jgi:NADPH:quinone reductase-like Zn-dependent oxidoreductase
MRTDRIESVGGVNGAVPASRDDPRPGSRAAFEAMNRAPALHRRQPGIDRVFPFARAIDPCRHFENRAHFGKVVISGG